MKVVQLKSDFPGSEWKRDFADALIRLCPDMNPDAADEASDSQYLTASSVAPHVAAERFAAVREQPPRGPEPIAIGS